MKTSQLFVAAEHRLSTFRWQSLTLKALLCLLLTGACLWYVFDLQNRQSVKTVITDQLTHTNQQLTDAQLENLHAAFLSLDRKQRTVSLLLFSMLLFGILWSIRKRLVKIDRLIQSYSDQLGVPHEAESNGDRIDRISACLNRFGKEMITETRALGYQARHDALTGLPNRALLLERLNAVIHHCQLKNDCMALFIMDLDHFKEVNDTVGHHAGDRLLQTVGRRLATALRHTDTVARLGGDEFAVLLPGASQAEIQAICDKIISIVDKPIQIEGMSLRVGISIGVAICPNHGYDISGLMRRADIAMYDAKQKQSGYSIYDKSQDKNNIARLGLSSDLRGAIDENQLLLKYQPLIDMKTGGISCVEALVRWQHPELGLIPPDEFISLAEQSGAIRPMTLWVINHALNQVAAWNKQGLDFNISINLSVHCLQDRQLPDHVQQLIDKYNINPRSIILEITESAIMSDPATARRVMRRLSNIGFNLSIDDFGTGYSSLAYLKQLPVNEIKIDKSFVSRMDVNQSDAVIVRATIELAHNLGLKVVAEGIESKQVWEQVKALGCDVAQGYFINTPLSAGELEQWVNSKEWEEADWSAHAYAES